MTVKKKIELVGPTIFIRVCAEHLYPVGLTSNRPEFICLLKYHRLEVGETRQIKTDLLKMLPRLVCARKGFL